MEVLLPPVLPVLTVLFLSVVQRRYGSRLGGRLAGFPTTTFPFLLVLLARDGAGTVAQAARGMIAGQLMVAAFCLGYGRLGRRLRTPAAAVTVALAVVAGAFSLGLEVPSPWAAAGLAFAITLAGLVTWPAVPPLDLVVRAPRWELPVRMAAAAGVVTVLTVLGRALGPQVTGLLSCVPIVLTVLTPATHRSAGFEAAETVVRSALRSLPATLVFAVVAALCVVPLGPLVGFVLAGAGLLVTDHLVGRLLAAQQSVAVDQPR
ncbi:hypothetical protein VSH64_20200 [Amycolatopsis rhabdoformis]|uniref:Uncharacterized protein n=1 Tax=Amycolatopsis rhabdoformis TaxID=1448059 RepID=A0ABZ1IKX7_9PSEU|nr:hypothetical protein [Amycolatopsis rhabdoformis]WSE34382.1 hypothetical protein VSH64_20200 [Amycolatopsis rhabdoformis]